MKLFSNPCKKRDRKATEKAILSAAQALFAEKGFEATRTLEIAKAAGANEALITRYFGGKEGLLFALMRDPQSLNELRSEECRKLENFPPKSAGKDFKDGILTFFKNGEKSLEMKEEFVRIGCARALVDPEMADVIRSHIMDEHLVAMTEQIRTYFDGDKKMKKAELEALAFLIMSVNFNMNFMGRKIYRMGSERIDLGLKIIAQALQAYVSSRDISKD